MKTLLVFCIAFMLATKAYSADMVIALSPHQAKDTLNQHASLILEAICKQPPASTLTLLDGYSVRSIATINIPDNPSYQQCKTIIKI